MDQQQNPQADNQNQRPLIEIHTHSINFRADAHRFQRKKIFLIFVTAVWWEVIIACIMLALTDIASSNNLNLTKPYLPLLIQICVFTSFLTIVGFLNQSYLNPALTYSTLTISIYTIAITILYGLQIDSQWIASIIFSIIYFIFTFVQAPRNIIIIGILLIQLNLIVSKLDARFDASWTIILLILIIIMVVACFVGVILVSLGVMERIGSPRFTVQSVGITYMGLVYICFALDAAVIIAKLMFSLSIYIIAVPCACFHLILIIYVIKNREEIYLFKSNAVVAHHLQEKIKYTKIEQYKKLYRISLNYYSLTPKKPPKQKDIMETQLVIHNFEDTIECAICLTDQALFVWMPCGHMAVCEACTNYLLQNNKPKCVICKRNAAQIYHLCCDQFKYEQTEYLSNFHYKIQII